MQSKQHTIEKYINWSLNVIGAAILSWLVIVLIMWMTKGAVFVYDSRITQFGICLEDSTFKPVDVVPISAGGFYVCGLVEGTTIRPGSLIVRRGTSPVYGESLTLPVGYFYLRVPLTEAFIPGAYYTHIGYARETLVEARFVVFKDQ
ncbi:MAG: hypothetical protein IPK16_26190 [Anaerolineales bacterium]|nr:hypothetical protein [Anaerolineales bacterium]